MQSIIPEVALAKEFGAKLRLDLHYRYYKQSAADFYEPIYADLAPILARDMRLGRVHDHTFGTEVQWQLFGERGNSSALAAVARFDLSLLRYEQLPTDAIVGKVFHLGLLGSYRAPALTLFISSSTSPIRNTPWFPKKMRLLSALRRCDARRFVAL